MTILEAFRATTESVSTWVEQKFLKKDSIDSFLSSNSKNPVQNKVVNNAIENLNSAINNIDVSDKVLEAIREIDYLVYSVNGKAGAVTLTASDVGALSSNTVIPDALSDLTSDATHRTVTDTEKATWNAKSDFSGNYNDLTNKPAIPSIDGLATENYVDTKVAGLVDSAPTTLDTLNELAAALGDDPNFATTIATQIGELEDKVENIDVSGQINTAIEEATADDFGIYVQDTEPTDAIDGDIWIDTVNDPSYTTPTLPDITSADNGKVLMVINGSLQLVDLNLSIDTNGVLSM